MKLFKYPIIAFLLLGIMLSAGTTVYADNKIKVQRRAVPPSGQDKKAVPTRTPISNEMTYQYLNNCKKKSDARISKDTQDIFCRCTAFQMQKTLTVEEMKLMAGTGETARLALNKMLLYVYAPCMEFPVRDLIYYKCRRDAYQGGEGICDCMSTKMAEYTSQEAQNQLAEILERDPDIYDPMESIIESGPFRKREKKIVLECIQEKLNKR